MSSRGRAAPAVEALIFDVDGTLAETEDHHRQAFNLAFSDAGIGWSWDVDLYRQLLAVTGGIERMRHYANLVGMPATDAELKHLHRAKNAAYAAFVEAGAVVLRPGIAALVEAARAASLRLAIATTTSLENVEVLIEATFGCKARRLFPVIVAGGMVARKKPAPDAYLLACQRLDLPPARCLAIEDSRNGVLAAKAARLRVVVVPSLYCRGEDVTMADLILDRSDALTLDRLVQLGSTGAGAAYVHRP
ncbi:HAD superfamily hydrolase (TIGR01509 family) [Rhodoligotrophos appendicifer]|uniref:HAD-IA family hydrolase n=1 Tax=Rhodoligotrophos appendicifer TaxID=987056 RepID=UPI0011849C1F|nr:HAD-IA family hydrolase [Rhodoligotrophos appendicifer]